MSGLVVEMLADPVSRAAAIDDLARLRIAVFREWPYLYEGSLDYEQTYLANFMAEASAVLVVARDGGRIVGAATASAMSGQESAFSDPFVARGEDIERLFYFGESVLLPAYRGRGVGHAFFDAREAGARAAGASACCFCAVVRPPDHPLRPAGARDLAPFWRARGYEALEGVTTSYAWQDIDRSEESEHPMQFWYRTL